MNADFRRETAEAANHAATGARDPAPLLAATSTREAVIRWLEWCDPNGTHGDEDAIAEGFDPYTEEDAWDALARMLEATK